MRTALLLTAAVLLAGCSDSQDSPIAPVPESGLRTAGAPLEASMRFGLAPGRVGTDFFPGSHDRSFHAYDNVRPQTVVIAAGGGKMGTKSGDSYVGFALPD